jgi:hypothetical protein
MTNITLPDFPENIEEGYIAVGDHFIDATEIVSMRRDQEQQSLYIH